MLLAFVSIVYLAPVLASVSVEYRGEGTVGLSWNEESTYDNIEIYEVFTDPVTGESSNSVIHAASRGSSGSIIVSRAPGIYRYFALVCRNQSCMTGDSVSLTIPIYGSYHFAGLTTGPDIVLANPSAGEILNPGTATVSVTANGRITISRIELFFEGDSVGVQTGNKSSYSFNINTQSEDQGYKKIKVVATGTNGETTTKSIVIQLGNVSSEYGGLLSNIPIDFSKYEIYYGDVDEDGLEGDIYFHGKEVFVLLHGDVAVPLFIPGPRGFVYSNDGLGSYSEPWQLDLSRSELEGLTPATEGVDYFFGDINSDTISDILLRGASENHSALLLSGTEGDGFAQALLTVSPEGVVTSTRYGAQLGVEIAANPSSRSAAINISGGQLDVGGTAYTFDTEALTIVSGAQANDIASSQSPYKPIPSMTHMGMHILDKTQGLSGQFRVNESGASTYSLPIKIADGTAGVAPQVSLNYNSQGGNGMLGLGWSLSASGGISRCRQTLLVDGTALPLSWDESDRFCLQRRSPVTGRRQSLWYRWCYL